MTSAHDRRRSHPVRFTLASSLGSGVDGAWWPHTAALARELPDLIDALSQPLGQIVDIAVNWSPLEGVPDLDVLNPRGVSALPGQESRRYRVMELTGTQARANLLVVPCTTSRAVALLLLRHAADLPILSSHRLTAAFQTADAIVRSARSQLTPSAAPAGDSSAGG